MKTLMKTMLVLVVISLMLVGCGSSVPDTPDGAVEAVAKGLSEKKPDILWEAMPKSYQEDANKLLHLYAEQMDPKVNDAMFEVVDKLEKALKNKKEFFVNSKMVRDMGVDKAEFEKNFNSVQDFIEIIADSEFKNLDSLKSADLGDILSNTGRDLMKAAADVSAATDDDQMKEMLEKLATVEAEIVKSDEKTATVKVKYDGDEKEDEFVKVDDRWVPKEMAEGWEEQMKQMKEQINSFTDQMSENSTKTVANLTALGSMIDSLNDSETQEEFDENMQTIQGELMKVMMGSMMRF